MQLMLHHWIHYYHHYLYHLTGVAAKQPQRLAQLVYLDAYLPFEGENEIALWPADQKEKYFADVASGIKFRPPISSSMLGITDPKTS
jgi:hypothetical protein